MASRLVSLSTEKQPDLNRQDKCPHVHRPYSERSAGEGPLDEKSTDARDAGDANPQGFVIPAA